MSTKGWLKCAPCVCCESQAAPSSASLPAKRRGVAEETTADLAGVSCTDPLAPGSTTFALKRTVSIAEAKLETSSLPTDVVVKIHGTGLRPSYLIPWQVKGQREWTGTGFVLPEQRILTNAHVVEDATVLQVTKQEDPKKFRAHVACIAHDVDLAIVKVEDPLFWADLPAATFAGELPDLYSEVKAVGFPSGGATVCVTKGVISRVDAQLYVHPQLCGIQDGSRNSPGSVIILQIDAAINPGNSGGPAFNDFGHVVGVASSGLPNRQNVGYIIPATIAKMFLSEYNETGKWSGLSEIGMVVEPLENDSMRRFLKMGNQNGVLVTDIAPLGALSRDVKPGDVITHIDDCDVTNEGTVPIVVAGQKVFVDIDALVTKKVKGEATTFRILRGGETMEVTVALTPIPPLAPRFHGYDSQPDFVLVGGIVFTRGTVPLYNEYLQARRGNATRFISDSVVWDHYDAYKEDDRHELVVLLTILKHDVNLGYGIEHTGILEAFNEQKMKSLAEFARLLGEAMCDESMEFFRFRTRKNCKQASDATRPDIVLERAKIEAADKDICATSRIPEVASRAMLPHLHRGARSNNS